MHKNKNYSRYIFLIMVNLFLFTANLEAAAQKPLFTGNFEQGQRVYADEEGKGNDYLFKAGWLRLKQNLTKNSYYYLKLGLAENNFIDKNVYDSRSCDLDFNYTNQVTKPLRFKTDLGFKTRSYPSAREKNYRQHTLGVEINYKLNKLDELTCTFKLQEEIYPLSNKDNLYSGVSLKWERKVNSSLSVHSGYNINGENYYDEASLTDRMRQAFSLGFEYQM